MVPTPLQMLLFAIAGWLNESQRLQIAFIEEQVRVLKELHGDRRLRLTDDQRRRLAAKGQGLGCRLLGELATIVTPDTILKWHRELIARKYDGSANRRGGRWSSLRTSWDGRSPGLPAREWNEQHPT